jgi:hypothetical protein
MPCGAACRVQDQNRLPSAIPQITGGERAFMNFRPHLRIARGDFAPGREWHRSNLCCRVLEIMVGDPTDESVPVSRFVNRSRAESPVIAENSRSARSAVQSVGLRVAFTT